MSYSNKTVWKLRDNIRSQNQYRLEESYAVLMKKNILLSLDRFSHSVCKRLIYTELRHLIYI